MFQMKDFVKMILAVVCGLLIVCILSLFFTIGAIGSLAVSSKSAQAPLPSSGILRMDFSQLSIAERESADNPLAMLQGMDGEQVSLLNAVRAIKAAASDPAVKAIYIRPDGCQDGVAVLQEVRTALSEFRASGKPVVAYVEAPSTGSYYLASVADKVYMTSHIGAQTMLLGVGSQMIFYKDLLDKLGVNVQLIRLGKYKSAGEPFIRSTPSQENLDQNQSMIDSMWGCLASAIAESRSISVEELNRLIDDLVLVSPQDFLESGLVDELLTREQLKEQLAKLAVKDDFKDVKMFSLGDYASAKLQPSKSKEKVAIIYADGQIVDADAMGQVCGDKLAATIAKVRADSSVKAVVFRVNSPGGSVLASEKIKAEIDALGAVKPVVASYGEYAASGGYWISSACEKIFSDPVTLTGSIGVFSIVPDFSKVMHDLGHVNVTSVSSNKHTDMFTMMRPFDNAEYQYMLASVEEVYDRFTGIVAQGRGLEKEYVDEIGQGRVWTGAQAAQIGLVDELGGLVDAIHWAGIAAGTPDNPAIVEYPAPASMFEEMFASMLGSGDAEQVIARSLKKSRGAVNMARLPYDYKICY